MPAFQNQKFSTLELCAGAGGAALGLEQAGFSHVALIDNNPHACATLRLNRPYWNVIEADIRSFDCSYWEGVDLVTGGLPCPPFSIAGHQLGSNDERDMFPTMLKIVKRLKPRAVLIENVRGILTSRFDSFRAQIDSFLQSIGYDTHWALLNAVDFGVPQVRYRAFLVALRLGESSNFCWPDPPNHPIATVGEAIGDMMSSGGWRDVNAWITQASAPAPTIVGGSHKHGGPDLGPTRARRAWAELGVDGLGIADEPPPRKFSGMPRLTVPMVARLQTFPDEWTFVGSKTQVYRQVGNALPVSFAYNIARALRKCLR